MVHVTGKRKYKDNEYKGDVLSITVHRHNKILEQAKNDYGKKLITLQKKLYEKEHEIKKLKVKCDILQKSGTIGKKSGSRKRLRNVK